MKNLLIAAALSLALSGCMSYSETPPQSETTIVLPPGSVITCTGGQISPC